MFDDTLLFRLSSGPADRKQAASKQPREDLVEMAARADPPGSEGRSTLKNLSEVVLNWSDFVFSLEKLRHKPFCKSTSERSVNSVCS